MALISEVKAVLILGLFALISHGVVCARHDSAETDDSPPPADAPSGAKSNGTGGAASGGNVFDVTSFGAKADGKFDNFPAFVKTWKAVCGGKTGAKMLIPAGTYRAGPLPFVGPCTNTAPAIEIQGTVMATTDISEYSSPEWISFDTVDGLTITGSGTLNGQGSSVWKNNDCKTNGNCALLPASVKMIKVTNADISGISSVDSKGFHFHITDCKNIKATNMKITAPGDSPNTDGIHVSNTGGVDFSKLTIGTGDDCISIGQGATGVKIDSITCGPGHGISIGSLGKVKNEADVSGITVTNSVLSGTTNGVRIKTWPGSPPSKASDIHFEGIELKNVKNPIAIDQHYGSSKSDPSNVKISNVSFKNIKGTSISSPVVSLMCSSAVPCEGIELADIDVTFSGTDSKGGSSSQCEHAKIVFSGKQNPPACKV